MNYLFMVMAAMTITLGTIKTVLADSGPLPALLQQTRFIAYTPRSFSITGGKVVAAKAPGMRADLKLLRPFFNGLITYSSANGIEAIPEIAHDLAYRAVIMGIWDPASEVELTNVLAAIRKYPNMVAAVIVGNEGIQSKRYRPADVEKTMQLIHKEFPGLPVCTSEPFSLYFDKDYLNFFSAHDLLMPNIHAVFQPWFAPSNPTQGVEMVLQVTEKLKKTYNKPLLIKETGMPSGESHKGFSPERQAQFWSELRHGFQLSPSQSLAYFEAFDAPWKPVDMATTFPGDHANEAFWGFFTVEGQAKPVVAALPRLEGF